MILEGVGEGLRGLRENGFHKDVLLALVGVVLVVFSLASLGSAFVLNAPYSSLSLYSSRTADVFVYVSATGSGAGTVSFSASSTGGYLETYLDSYDSSLQPGGSRGATIHVVAPSSMMGCDTLVVSATVCSSGGSCETRSKNIRVSVLPSKDSSYYINGQIDYCTNNYAPNSGQDGSHVQSTLEFVGRFDPTEYDAQFVDSYFLGSFPSTISQRT